MLRLITGRAGTGKTAQIMEEISAAVAAKIDGQILIVPEQFSHEAERELCARAGDGMSLYAEVFSFTGLSRRMTSLYGGGAKPYLDKGGKLLCMTRVLTDAAQNLKLYAHAATRPEIQAKLIKAVDDLKASCVSGEALFEAAQYCDSQLALKLNEIAYISEMMDAVINNSNTNPSDRFTVLAQQLREEYNLPFKRVWVDGFTDFTRQELEVLFAFMARGIDVTVCLTLDSVNGKEGVFSPARYAAAVLMRKAGEMNTELVIQNESGASAKNPAIAYCTEHLFSFGGKGFTGDKSSVGLYRAANVTEECEFAAAKVLELVSNGCRWRDVAVAVRGYDDYRSLIESVFGHYGVPLYSARKSDMLSKPLPAMIAGVYSIVYGGWDVDEIVSYMRTGLTGLTLEECDILQSYIETWQLRASAWFRREDWQQHPDGYGKKYDEKTEEQLRTINALRRKLSDPLISFNTRGKKAFTAKEHADNLTQFMKETKLPQILAARAKALSEAGMDTAAAEYRQLWKTICQALEQTVGIIGDVGMDGMRFGKLFTEMLAGYDTGSIPVSLDRVSAGDFDRMRRRSIKHLIVLGADDSRLPPADSESGIFTKDELNELKEQNIIIGSGEESELWREFSLIYNCLSMPSETLTLCYSSTASDGSIRDISPICKAVKRSLDRKVQSVDLIRVRSRALGPALTLAAAGLSGGNAEERAAREYFEEYRPDDLTPALTAAQTGRGKLSSSGVYNIYGENIRLSPSKMDQFAKCRFGYFCKFGMKAEADKPAEFDAVEIGSFTHTILELVARETMKLGGFKVVTDEVLSALTDKYIKEYITNEFNDFAEKSQRFIYLFNRVANDMRSIVLDTAAELRRSDFIPESFEFNFAKNELEAPSEDYPSLSGIADRIDCWEHDGKLYLRVTDYKTGKKDFRLKDIYNGFNLQMLVYLFTLNANSQKLYGKETVPAGIMYIPARNDIQTQPYKPSEIEIRKTKDKAVRRKGIVLDDEAVKEAWDHSDITDSGENKDEGRVYIPLKHRGSKPTAETFVNLEKMGILESHIEKCVREMSGLIHDGDITANPIINQSCINCDYAKVCCFEDGERGDRGRVLPSLKDSEMWELMEESKNGKA